MASLVDLFRADLVDDLDFPEDTNANAQQQAASSSSSSSTTTSAATSSSSSSSSLLDDFANDAGLSSTSTAASVRDIAHLLHTEQLPRVVREIEAINAYHDSLKKEEDEDEDEDDGGGEAAAVAMSVTNTSSSASSSLTTTTRCPSLTDSPKDEYQRIVDCNELLSSIDDEVANVHKFVRDHYAPRFPELEQMVVTSMDFIRVVRRLGNETDTSGLADILPATTIMMVSIASASTSGQVLAPDVYQRVMDACDEALELSRCRKLMLDYVQGKMATIAPNLVAIVGASVSSLLVGLAGGLFALSKLPAGTVQVLGRSHQNLSGFSVLNDATRHVGVIYDCDVVMNTPQSLRDRASRLVAGKCTLAARVDATTEGKDDAYGEGLRADILKKIEKWQEPPPAKLIKPLPAPDMVKKKRRGGRRHRKMKEKYAMSDIQKQANRLAFGVVAEETAGMEGGTGLGMVGVGGSGQLRLTTKQRKDKFVKQERQKREQAQVRHRQQLRAAGHGAAGTGTSTSGTASSLAFTPVQGIELENPMMLQRVKEANDKYFSGAQSFLKSGTKRKAAE